MKTTTATMANRRGDILDGKFGEHRASLDPPRAPEGSRGCFFLLVAGRVCSERSGTMSFM